MEWRREIGTAIFLAAASGAYGLAVRLEIIPDAPRIVLAALITATFVAPLWMLWGHEKVRDAARSFKLKRGRMAYVAFVCSGAIVGGILGAAWCWCLTAPAEKTETTPPYVPPIDTTMFYSNLNRLEKEILRQQRERASGVEIRRSGFQPPRIYGPTPPRKVSFVYESEQQKEMAQAIGNQFMKLGWQPEYVGVRNDYNWHGSGITIHGKDSTLIKSVADAIEDALHEKKPHRTVTYSPSDDPVLDDSLRIDVATPPSDRSRL